jgi:hypothetical protein
MIFKTGDIVKHVKSGRDYQIYGLCIIEETNTIAYYYKSNSKGVVWIRSKAEMEDGRFVLVTLTQSEMFRLTALKAALRLEVIGMKRSRSPSAYISVKRLLNCKGTKRTVLKLLEDYIVTEKERITRNAIESGRIDTIQNTV